MPSRARYPSRPDRLLARGTFGTVVNMIEEPILICYDGSEEARRAIEAAAGLLSARQAVILDVGPPLTLVQSYAKVFAPVNPGFEADNAEVALERATAGLEQARRAGFEAVARSDVAAPTWEGIVEYANEIDAAVIVMGSHGRDAGAELIHGSVSHQVAAHAGRPVLIVPPPHDD
jgi:nucleotide-binding universal stress UspA family protein